MAYESIIVEVVAGVAEITLNRPDKLNAFTAAMLEELNHAITAAGEDDAVRAVLITGAGRAFSAGQDLEDRSVAIGEGRRPDLHHTLSTGYNPLMLKMRDLPKPIVMAVNGVAAGAAANIALSGDIVIAGKGTRFIQAFSKIGLMPDSGGTYFLPRLIGRAEAMGLAMLATTINGQQAEERGLIWEAVDDEVLLDEARSLARQLAAGPTLAFGFIKRAINASYDNDLETQLALEAELQGIAGSSDDYAEGVAAFMGKRAPKFKGR